MPFVATAALIALVYAFIDFLKAVTNKNVNAAVTQLIGWAAGTGAVFVAGASQFASEIKIGDHTLLSLNGPTKLFVGLMIASTAKVAFDLKKSLDTSDSAVQPKLIP